MRNSIYFLIILITLSMGMTLSAYILTANPIIPFAILSLTLLAFVCALYADTWIAKHYKLQRFNRQDSHNLLDTLQKFSAKAHIFPPKLMLSPELGYESFSYGFFAKNQNIVLGQKILKDFSTENIHCLLAFHTYAIRHNLAFKQSLWFPYKAIFVSIFKLPVKPLLKLRLPFMSPSQRTIFTIDALTGNLVHKNQYGRALFDTQQMIANSPRLKLAPLSLWHYNLAHHGPKNNGDIKTRVLKSCNQYPI